MCFVGLLLLAVSLPAGAQERSNDLQIIEATAAHFATLLGDSTIVVDPRIAARAHRSIAGTFEGDWPPEIVQAMRMRLDARVAQQVEIFQCAGRDPRTCRVVGTDVFMKFGRPQVEGLTATLYVDIMRKTFSRRSPVATRQHEVVLNRSREGWRVVSNREVAAS
jgi:hypothetical protein